MRVVQTCPLHSAQAAHLRDQSRTEAYRARRAPWGQSTRRALLEDVLSGEAASAKTRPTSSQSARRLLHLVFAVLAVLAVAGAFAPAWFGVGS